MANDSRKSGREQGDDLVDQRFLVAGLAQLPLEGVEELALLVDVQLMAMGERTRAMDETGEAFRFSSRPWPSAPSFLALRERAGRRRGRWPCKCDRFGCIKPITYHVIALEVSDESGRSMHTFCPESGRRW
jgi:hypothetical protein